ncbi:MAG: hypothetical protein DI537_17445 [Stutzerimonas stutzeri]|nr:MAG: hypothetical protein DI537_17445 [Stutzerimonas stutzeri]
MTLSLKSLEVLLESYNRLRRAEERRIALLPDRLKTMVADTEWIEAIFEKNQALDAFISAARTACVTWSGELPQSDGITPIRSTSIDRPKHRGEGSAEAS